jgi:hypothetical protein
MEFFLLASEAVVRRNVTVTGLAYERTLSFSGSMNGTVRSTTLVSVQGRSGDCPAGRYCPAGTSDPILCPAGFYSSQARRSTTCPFKCFANYYCPDPGKLVQCPANTHSAPGGSSQVDCKCDPGFQCVYRRQINLNLMLNIPYKVWMGPGGAELSAAVVQAVAESAGVPVGSVRIQQVLPSAVSGGVSAGGGGTGGGRRLLALGGQGAALLRLSVEGAERLEGLQERLARHDKFREGARVIWRRADQLRVVSTPDKGSWGWMGLIKNYLKP